MRGSLLAPFALALACSGSSPAPPRAPEPTEAELAPPGLPWRASAAGRSAAVDSPATLLRGGTVMTATGRALAGADVLFEDGNIVAVGRGLSARGAEVIDVTGKWITPGLIDTHSHAGVYPVPYVEAHDDGNEATAPVTAQVAAADSFWPQDPALNRMLAAGVTTIQVLPGSANLIGGRSIVMHLEPARSAAEMRFPGAPDGLKVACGENPKRVYGERDQAPSTRMGNIAGQRAAFQGAREYRDQWLSWQGQWRVWKGKRLAFERARRQADAGPPDADAGAPAEDPGPEPPPPARDFGKETMLEVIEGRVLVQNHCYRADEMLRMIELGREFGFRIRSFHHAVEAYKIRDVLAREGVAISTWADWWGFKLEAFDAVPENLALLTEAGVRAVLHSDSPMYVQRFNQEAAKAMFAGRAAGIPIDEVQALRWITANPAWVLGIEERVGTLERGKIADVVVWSGSPWSVYTRVERTYVSGRLRWDRQHPERAVVSDFELGLGSGATP